MRGLMKTELKKAFRSPWFLSAVLIGLACALWELWDCARMFYKPGGWYYICKLSMERNTFWSSPESFTLYNSWLGFSESTAHTVFYRIFPLLALLPCGHNISEEINGGYVKAVVPLVGRRKYFSAKLLASFLAGGAAVSVPLLASLALTAAVVPGLTPLPYLSEYYTVSAGDVFASIAYSRPLLYALAFIGVDFVFGGLFACLALPVALRSEKRVAALAVPYICLLLADAAKGLLLNINYLEISPLDILSACRYGASRSWIYGLWLAVLVGANLALGLWKGGKRDIV